LTVLVGLFGLVLGLAIGFAVGLRKHASDPAWLEAIGTWVGAGVTLLAVILAGIVFFSEEYARRREYRRGLEAANQARQKELAELQQQANLVNCDAHFASGNPVEPGLLLVSHIWVEAMNWSSHSVTSVFCRVPQIGDEPIKLSDELKPGAPKAIQQIQVHNRFTVHEDNRELRESATFTFSLGGVNWLAKYGQEAKRLDSGPIAESN
jgi:hypothetical protein